MKSDTSASENSSSSTIYQLPQPTEPFNSCEDHIMNSTQRDPQPTGEVVLGASHQEKIHPTTARDEAAHHQMKLQRSIFEIFYEILPTKIKEEFKLEHILMGHDHKGSMGVQQEGSKESMTSREIKGPVKDSSDQNKPERFKVRTLQDVKAGVEKDQQPNR